MITSMDSSNPNYKTLISPLSAKLLDVANRLYTDIYWLSYKNKIFPQF